MELRDDREHTITGIQPHDRRGAGRDRVQVRRAMRVDDALGVARRAARVAHGRRGGLIRFRVVEAGRLSGEELVVTVHGAARGDQRRRVAVANDDPRLDRRELRRHRPDDRQERRVDEHDAIPGVVRHIHQLLARQADVERVEHSAHARDGEVRLEVLLVVPHERADGIARADPEAAERGGEPVGVVSHLSVRGPPDTVARERHALRAGVDATAVAQDGVDREREVAHGRADHASSSIVPRRHKVSALENDLSSRK